MANLTLRHPHTAGLAANLGLAGLGTDTGNSVRGPSGHTSMVGIRPSLGLTSRCVLYANLSTGVSVHAVPVGLTCISLTGHAGAKQSSRQEACGCSHSLVK